MASSFWHELAGGTVGGVIGMTVVYPLDTVKSRLQTSGQSRYSGTMHVLTSMAKQEGPMSLYRGLLSPVASCGVIFAVGFSSNGETGRMLLRRRGAAEGSGLTVAEMALAGGVAGVFSSPLRQISERVKSIMQVRRGEKRKAPYSWSGACAVDLVRREGIVMGLFRGMGAILAREILQSAVYYPTYALAKGFLMPPDRLYHGPVPEPVMQMLAGGIAGSISWLPPFYSLDVIKTRMQTAEPGKYKNFGDCALKTWRAEGARAFVRGLAPSLLRAFPMHGLVFVGYETTISFLGYRPRPTSVTADGDAEHQLPQVKVTGQAGPDFRETGS